MSNKGKQTEQNGQGVPAFKPVPETQAPHAPQVDLGMREPAPVLHAAVSENQPGQITQPSAGRNLGQNPHYDPAQVQQAPVPPAQVAHEPAPKYCSQTGRPLAPQSPTEPGKLVHAPYVTKSVGFPVQPGETWHHLTPEQRKQWFNDHENRWKQRFGIQNAGVTANLNWSRG
jgi:hypothetical protein